MRDKGKLQQRGFTLLELCVVVAIGLVLTAAAIPSITQNVQAIRLRSSAESIQGLLQRGRQQAVRDNRFYSVIPNAAIGNSTMACVDLSRNGVCNAAGGGEPDVQLSQNVNVIPWTAAPSTLAIYCGTSPVTQPCPPGYIGLNYQPMGAAILPTFNGRGFPCTQGGAVEPAFPGNCSEFNGAVAGGNQVGYLVALQYGNTNQYAAVAVSPAGLINTYVYTGVDANGNFGWRAE